VQAEAAGIADGPNAFSSVFGAYRLGCIFNYEQVMFLGHSHYPVHVGWSAGQVYRQDSLGLWSDGGFQQRRVHVVVVTNIDEHWNSADMGDTTGTGKKGTWNRNDFVPFAYVQGLEGEDQGVGAGVQSDGKSASGQFREPLFKLVDFFAKNELATVYHAFHRCHQLVFDGRVLGCEIYIRNLKQL